MSVATGLTIEDFETLPDALALNHELVDGELIDVSGNINDHIRLQIEITSILRDFVNRNKLGLVLAEQEFAFGDNAHGPDITFIGPEKRTLINGRRRVQLFVPDLAIEIVSAGDRFESLLKKCRLYRQCGTREVLILSIDLRQAILLSETGDRLLSADDSFAPTTLPGFSVQIGELLDSIRLD
jgi:Uma2 family endonuclease